MKIRLFTILQVSLMFLFFFNSCKKENTVPELSTCSISEITEFTATCNATISDDGGAGVTARGFVWDTAAGPSLDKNLGFSTNGTGSGSFTKNLTDLNPKTKYYIKAYATNEVGTAYSEVTFFTTAELAWNGTPCTDCATVTDIEGNVYRTVSIGSQCWLVENLKTTKFNDGSNIPNVVANNEWNTITTAAYTWYENDIANKDSYGALYNYYAVESDKLCPTGWHVATDNEWKQLEGSVDSQYEVGNTEWDKTEWRGQDAGVKLKSREQWLYGGVGTDNFGFSALPGGDIDGQSGAFERVGEWGTWWVAKDGTETDVYRRYLTNHEDKIARFPSNPRSGYSVRCIKD